MRWRYGIVKFHNKHNPDFRFYGIGELFYDEDPLQPHSCTENPIDPYAELEEDSTEESVKAEIRVVLNRMLKDCDKYPIFDIDGPYAKAPWDGKRDIGDLTIEQLQTMSDEEIENWLEAKNQ